MSTLAGLTQLLPQWMLQLSSQVLVGCPTSIIPGESSGSLPFMMLCNIISGVKEASFVPTASDLQVVSNEVEFLIKGYSKPQEINSYDSVKSLAGQSWRSLTTALNWDWSRKHAQTGGFQSEQG